MYANFNFYFDASFFLKFEKKNENINQCDKNLRVNLKSRMQIFIIVPEL